MVKESRKLKHEDLTEPIPVKSARYISDTTVEIIQSFYQSDEVSRILPDKKDFVSVYHDLIAKMVCSLDSKLCMLHRCDHCPGKNGLQEYFQYKLEDVNYEDEMMIHFKHWVSTDRTT